LVSEKFAEITENMPTANKKKTIFPNCSAKILRPINKNKSTQNRKIIPTINKNFVEGLINIRDKIK
jgi:hypothetical protein